MASIDESSDRTEVTLDPATARVLNGLRLVVVAVDRERAEQLAAELMRWDLTVEVLEPSPDADLAAARALDPEVVLLDPTGLGGAAQTLTRALNADERLCWASLLRCELDKVWPRDDPRPNLHRLASLVAPLVNAERSLRERVNTQDAVLTELDRTGPSRVLRVLRSGEGAYALTVQSPDARAELMIDNGRVAKAVYDEVHVTGPPSSGQAAIEAFMTLRAGVVEIVRAPDAAFENDETAQMGPPKELLDALRDEDEDEEIEVDELFDDAFDMGSITEEYVLLRGYDELPGEATHASERAPVDSEHPTAENPPIVFPLPDLIDDELDEVTKKNVDTAYPQSHSEPSPPMPPKPSFSPREGAERGSSMPPPVSAPVELPELTAPKSVSSMPPISAGLVAEASRSSSSAPPPSRSSAPPPSASAPPARSEAPVSSPEVTEKLPARPSVQEPSTMPVAAIAVVGALVAVGAIVWASQRGGEPQVASRDSAPVASPPPVEAVPSSEVPEPEPEPEPAPEAVEEVAAVVEEEPAVVEEEPAVVEEAPSVDAPLVAAPSDPTLTPRQRSNQILEGADALELPDAAEEALPLYEAAVAIDPVNARALLGLARVHLARNNPRRALTPATRAAGLAPNRTSYRMLLGDVHFALGDTEAARAVWLEAYEIRPSARLRGRLDRVGRPVDDPENTTESVSAEPERVDLVDASEATP